MKENINRTRCALVLLFTPLSGVAGALLAHATASPGSADVWLMMLFSASVGVPLIFVLRAQLSTEGRQSVSLARWIPDGWTLVLVATVGNCVLPAYWPPTAEDVVGWMRARLRSPQRSH